MRKQINFIPKHIRYSRASVQIQPKSDVWWFRLFVGNNKLPWSFYGFTVQARKRRGD